jgi:hypothetical protein
MSLDHIAFEPGFVVLADGTRLKAISGGQGGMGAGAGGGGMASAAGAGQNIDWTFGQKEVYDERVKREMGLLTSLIRNTPPGANVNTGQTPGAAQRAQTWDPSSILALARLFSFRG